MTIGFLIDIWRCVFVFCRSWILYDIVLYDHTPWLGLLWAAGCRQVVDLGTKGAAGECHMSFYWFCALVPQLWLTSKSRSMQGDWVLRHKIQDIPKPILSDPKAWWAMVPAHVSYRCSQTFSWESVSNKQVEGATANSSDCRCQLVFPGAFSPVHMGHLVMMDQARWGSVPVVSR